MNRLSPLTLSNLLHRAEQLVNGEDAGTTVESEIRWVYFCPTCNDQHDDELDAIECCGDCSDDAKSCPVCGSLCADEYAATDCCLWKDLPPAMRHMVAQARERGATWLDAIANVADVN